LFAPPPIKISGNALAPKGGIQKSGSGSVVNLGACRSWIEAQKTFHFRKVDWANPGSISRGSCDPSFTFNKKKKAKI